VEERTLYFMGKPIGRLKGTTAVLDEYKLPVSKEEIEKAICFMNQNMVTDMLIHRIEYKSNVHKCNYVYIGHEIKREKVLNIWDGNAVKWFLKDGKKIVPICYCPFCGEKLEV